MQRCAEGLPNHEDSVKSLLPNAGQSSATNCFFSFVDINPLFLKFLYILCFFLPR